MVDVRSMLRTERAARTQPPPRKAVAVEQKAPSANKKRKAGDDEDEGRKRTKVPDATGIPQDFFDEDVAKAPESRPEIERTPSIETTQFTSRPATTEATTATAQPPSAPAVDEEEWAAFERDIATPPRENLVPAALKGAATISAAPVTAAELAAQAREDQSTQRGRREAETEAEKEDAARHLEEEFDEMESLEERVRRLREKREALRKAREESNPDPEPENTAVSASAENASEDSDEDVDDDEDFDDWRFRPA